MAVYTSAAIHQKEQTNLVPFVLISPKEKAPLDGIVKVLLESNSASVSAGGLVVSADPDPSLATDAVVQKCWQRLLRDDLRPLTRPGKVLQ